MQVRPVAMVSSTVLSYDALTTHTFTAILLHGRGSSGREFADDLLTLPLSEDGDTLRTRLPEWKWVFPSAQMRWSTAFQEDVAAWFEAHSLTDISARQDLQVDGIEASVAYISDLVQAESRLLKDGSKRVLLGGISQGAAVGLWTMLCQSSKRLAGFVGASGWLPFANEIINFFGDPSDASEDANLAFGAGNRAWDSLKPALIHTRRDLIRFGENCPLLSIPIFWGHGIDDAYVDVSLGRQVRDALRGIGMDVLWNEYSGAEEEGHWLKEPEEVIDIADFMATLAS